VAYLGTIKNRETLKARRNIMIQTETPNSGSNDWRSLRVEPTNGLGLVTTEHEEIEFLGRVNKAILDIRVLAKKTFAMLASELTAHGVAKAVDSAASTHAALGGNLATAAYGIAKAVDSAASTHAALGGNLATAAYGVAKAVDSDASTHAALGGNLATAACGVAKAATEDTVPFAEQEYVHQFRTLVLTMLGEIPRKGHLTSDFDDMFDIAHDKTVTLMQFRDMGAIMVKVMEDWTSENFLSGPKEMINEMRANLLKIAAVMGITEKIPSTFSEEDMVVVPHIALLNDFMDSLLGKIDGRGAAYQSGIEGNNELLESARQIVKSHRDANSPLAFKILRTALLENTAQARIDGLRVIADTYGLGQHIYLTTHDIVEGYHGRDALEQLRAFVHSSNTPIAMLDAYLEEIMAEIFSFYAGMSRCVQ